MAVLDALHKKASNGITAQSFAPQDLVIMKEHAISPILEITFLGRV